MINSGGKGGVSTMHHRRIVVAIPARNEAERIVSCLAALAAQRGAACDAVVVLLNNCTDRTEDAVRARAGALPYVVRLEERQFPPELAHAGTARSAAMSVAAEEAGPEGLLLTTDADGMADPLWLANTLSAIARGAEVVCGRAVLQSAEAALIPSHLHDDDEIECRYGRLLDEIHHRLDPDPDDPWPRHTEHSGASIAVTVEAWARAGGVPASPCGEDRAFLRALRRVDARVRHAPDVMVGVSARLVGRAPGGMAETIARRMVEQDPIVDASLEPVATCVSRAALRSGLRRLYRDPGQVALAAFATRAGILPSKVRAHLALPFFGAAWDAVEALSPRLEPTLVARANLAELIAEAETVLEPLRCGGIGASPADFLTPRIQSRVSISSGTAPEV